MKLGKSESKSNAHPNEEERLDCLCVCFQMFDLLCSSMFSWRNEGACIRIHYLKEKHEMSIKVMHFLREHAFNHRLNTELFEVIVLLTRANEDNR